jgi:hypothetical protein
MNSRVACLGTGFGYFLFVLYCKDMASYKKTLRHPTALQRVKRIVRVVMVGLLVLGFLKVQFDVAGRPRAFDGQTRSNPITELVDGLTKTAGDLGDWIRGKVNSPNSTTNSTDKPVTGNDVRIGEAENQYYNRKEQYGNGWVDTDHNGCDTRNDVLQRHGQNVKLHKNGCIVLSSTIHDVYNGVDIQQTHKGGQIEIDHIVPLSYAHQHGAAHWTQEKRVKFANDVENLLPVSSKDNSSKGDKGPADWRPADTSYSCQYGKSFLHIIEKYDLTISQTDYTAIQGFC